MLPTTCTLVYTATSTTVAATVLEAAMAAVVLYSKPATDPVLLGLYDCTVLSDTPSIAGADAIRTIVLTLGAGFFALFPSASSWDGAFPDFYTHTLEQGTQVAAADMVAADPVFA